MRQWDAKTILYNAFFDGKRMLDDGMRSRDVFNYLKKKLDFLEHPAPGNKVKW
jgi:hypothetical protein